MSKLVFLDIDGVLNSWWTENPSKKAYIRESDIWGVNTDLVQRLNQLVSDDIDFVLSSSWRKLFRLSVINQFLQEAGFLGVLEGRTPFLVGSPRGAEIALYMKHYCNSYASRVDSLVILDDDSDMEPLLHRHVQTHNKFGLQNKDIKEALRILEIPFDAEVEL